MKIAKAPCALRVNHKGSHNAKRRWGQIIEESAPPAEYEGLCAKWMPRAQTWCAASAGHYGRCYTMASATRQRSAQSAMASATQARRRAMLAVVKVTAGCVDCGFDGHPAALDFDHRPGETKLRDISKMLTVSLDNLFAEVAKCDVVCANCHRIRTYRRNNGPEFLTYRDLTGNDRSDDDLRRGWAAYPSRAMAEQ